MKIGLKGSVNNKIEEFAEEVNRANVDFVICTGDFGFYPELQYIDIVDPYIKKHYPNLKLLEYDVTKTYFNKPVYVVPGNHEDHEYLSDKGIDDFGIVNINNLYFIHNNFVSPKADKKVTIFAFGKIYADSAYNLNKQNIEQYGARSNRKAIKTHTKKRSYFLKSEVDTAIQKICNYNWHYRDWSKETVIFISHDAPPHRDESKGYTEGSIVIRDLTQLLAPDFAFFGHYKSNYIFEDWMYIVPEEQFTILTI